MPGTAQSTGTTDAIRPHPSRRRDVVIYFVRYRLLFRPAASPSVVVVVVVAVVVAVVLERGTAKEFRFQFRFAFFCSLPMWNVRLPRGRSGWRPHRNSVEKKNSVTSELED